MRERGAPRIRATQRNVVAHSLHQPPDSVAKEQVDRRFAILSIRRGGLIVSGPNDLAEFVLTQQDGQHDLAVRTSLAQRAGTLGCVIAIGIPMNIEISYATMIPGCFRNR